MSNKGIPDLDIVEMARRCCLLDRVSNEIHAAIRAKRSLDRGDAEVLAHITETLEICTRLLKDPPKTKGNEPLRGVSFTLRAAHEVLDAMIAFRSLERSSEANLPT